MDESNEITPESPGRTYPKKNCKNCGNEFEARTSKAEFCGTPCRAKYFRANNQNVPAQRSNDPIMQRSSAMASPSIVASLGALPPAAQYIIATQEKEIKRFEESYKEERTRRKEAEKEVQRLKDEMRDKDFKQQLNGIENEKPAAWEKILGFLPPEVFTTLAGAIKDKMIAPAGIAGVEGQMDGQTQTQITEFSTWFASLPKELRDQLYNILVSIAKAGDNTGNLLIQIQNLLTNGTTITPQQTLFATGN